MTGAVATDRNSTTIPRSIGLIPFTENAEKFISVVYKIDVREGTSNMRVRWVRYTVYNTTYTYVYYMYARPAGRFDRVYQSVRLIDNNSALLMSSSRLIRMWASLVQLPSCYYETTRLTLYPVSSSSSLPFFSFPLSLCISIYLTLFRMWGAPYYPSHDIFITYYSRITINRFKWTTTQIVVELLLLV